MLARLTELTPEIGLGAAVLVALTLGPRFYRDFVEPELEAEAVRRMA